MIKINIYMSLSKKIFFSFVTFFLFLLTLEIIIYTLLPNLIISHKKNLYAENNEYGWTWIKNNESQIYHEYKRKPVVFKTNDYGFRINENKEKDLSKNFIFIGDSITAGKDINYNDIFSSLVAKEFGFNDINLAVNGYSTDQSYLVLKNFINKPSIDAVFYTLVNNDINQNSKNFADFNGVKIGKPLIDKKGKLIKKSYFKKDKRSKIEVVKSFLRRNSNIYSTVAILKNYLSLKKLQSSKSFYSLDIKKYDVSNIYLRNAIDNTFRLINLMKNISEKNNTNFYLVEAFHLDYAKYEYYNLEYQIILKNYRNYLKEKSKEYKINFIYMKNIKELSQNFNEYFISLNDIIVDGHYSKSGHEKLSQLIISELKSDKYKLN